MFPFWAPGLFVLLVDGPQGWLGSIGLLSQLPSLSSRHVSFSVAWVGWVAHPFRSLHVGMGGPGLGSHSAPFIGMGGPRPRGWAPVGRIGSDGWSAAKAGLPFGSLHVSFLGSWVGWVGRGQESGFFGLPSCFLSGAVGSDGWAAAKGLGARHVSFLGSWVRSCSRLGWMGRAHKAGLQWPPFAAKAAPITKFPSCFVFGLLGWMGGPRGFYCLVCRQILAQICAALSLLFPARQPQQCVYQALLQQNPVQYARRPTCGKNRDRFRVKKPLQPHTWHIKLFYSKILCSMLVGQPAGKIGIASV